MQITTKLDKAKIQLHLDHALNNALTHIVENLVQYKLNKNLPEVEDYQSMHDWFSFDEEKLGKVLEGKVYSLVNFMTRGPFNHNDPFGHSQPTMGVDSSIPRYQSQPQTTPPVFVQPGFQQPYPQQMTPMMNSRFVQPNALSMPTTFQSPFNPFNGILNPNASLIDHAKVKKYLSETKSRPTVYTKTNARPSPLVIKDILDVCVSIDPSGHYCLAQTANRLDDGRFLMLKCVNPNNNELVTKFYILYSCQERTYILGDTEKTVFAKAYMLTGDPVLSYGESKIPNEFMVDTSETKQETSA